MPRFTLLAWFCNLPCGQRNLPTDKNCTKCGTAHHERYAQVRESEVAYIDLAPDGTITVPGRSDAPLHPKQVALGVQRVPITSALSGRHSLKHLETLGLVHEATNWNSEGGNMTVIAEEMPDLTPKSVDQILAEPDAF